MEERTLTCIGCPMGCQVSVQMGAGKILSVTGNTCPRGDAYAREEVTAPARTVTSTSPHPLQNSIRRPQTENLRSHGADPQSGRKGSGQARGCSDPQCGGHRRRCDRNGRRAVRARRRWHAGDWQAAGTAPRRAADKSRARREVPSHSPAARPARDIMQQYTASRGEGPRLVNTLGDYHEEICNGA